MGGVLRTNAWLPIVGLPFAALAACSGDDNQSATGKPFACPDFLGSVTSGPRAGRSWTGDLILTQDETGAFTGVLVPVGATDRQTIEVRDRSGASCRAVGQRHGPQVSWFLDGQNNERILGTGQIRPVANGEQELRGIINGPTDRDFGVYHGRNYLPYIRIISPNRD